MKAIEISQPGGSEVLRLVNRKIPTPDHDELLIKVSAVGVNRPDILQREGKYPPPPGASDILGLEVSGTVCEIGELVQGHVEGERVCALVTGGGYAEYCTVPAAQVLPVPSGLDMIEAAALPEAFFTVWTNVFDRGHLQSGECFLVHGGSSGIGTTAIQLASAFGARVFATAGSADKCNACNQLGAEHTINYKQEDFVKITKGLTDGLGLNLILDMVGGDYLQRNFSALAPEGRLVQIAFLKGSNVKVNLMPIMLKKLTFTGATLRSRPTEEKAQIADALKKRVWPLIESARVRPVIDSVMPLTNAHKAHERMEAGEHIGKIVLRVEP